MIVPKPKPNASTSASHDRASLAPTADCIALARTGRANCRGRVAWLDAGARVTIFARSKRRAILRRPVYSSGQDCKGPSARKVPGLRHDTLTLAYCAFAI